MDLAKRIYHFISSVIVYSIFFILVVIGLCVALYFIDQYQGNKKGIDRSPLFGAYVIISPSMEPNIRVRDAVVTMRKPQEKIYKGDVITFISKDEAHYGIRITHRIVGIFENENNSVSYRTKGDNNNVEDSSLVNYKNVLGKVMLKIPYIGYLQEFISTVYGWAILIVFPCVLIIISDIFKLMKKSRKKSNTYNNDDNKNKEKKV